MPEQTTEPQVWLDHAIYLFRDSPISGEPRLLILEPTGIEPVDNGPRWFEGEEEGHDIILAGYPGSELVDDRTFDNELQHRQSGGTRPRHFFYTPDREKVKASMTPDQLEYVTALEKVVNAAYDLWSLQSDPKQRVNASNDLYGRLEVVDFLFVREEDQ